MPVPVIDCRTLSISLTLNNFSHHMKSNYITTTHVEWLLPSLCLCVSGCVCVCTLSSINAGQRCQTRAHPGLYYVEQVLTILSVVRNS